MEKVELKQWISEGKRQTDIAKLCGISRQRVCQLIKKWKLEDLYEEQREKKAQQIIEERRKKFGCKDVVSKEFYTELRRRFRVKKGNSKRLGIPFELDFTDVIWNLRCPLLDEPLDYFSKNGRWAPTFDRIDPRLGYVPGNVWIISRRANAIKRDFLPEEAPEFFSRINLIMLAS